MELNWIDFMILAVVAISTVVGLFAGFVRRAVAVVGLGAAVLSALAFYDVLGAYLMERGVVSAPAVASVGSFIVIVFVVYVVFVFVGRFLGMFVRALSLGWLDRLAGGLVGAVTGIVVSVGVVWLLTTFSLEVRIQLRSSVLYPYVERAFGAIERLVPERPKERLEKAAESLGEKEKVIKEAIKKRGYE